MSVSARLFCSLGILLALTVPDPGEAAIKNSKHDLSILGGSPCAYCHSVHNAVGGLGRPAYMGPLPVITKVYNSATLDHTLDLATVNNSDAPICLSCHDGAFVATLTDVDVRTDLTAALAANPLLDIGGPDPAGGDLSNDHPSGFVYDATLDPQLKDPTNPKINVTFGPNRNEMWCSTCHNVHDNTYPPFLATSNSNSTLCLDCHIK